MMWNRYMFAFFLVSTMGTSVVRAQPANQAAVTTSVKSEAVEPLSEIEQKAYATIEADPPPTAITRNAHYIVSDEREHYLLREQVEGIRGAYIGVGTNQNYEFIGWARSEIVFLLDFDQLIVDLHGAYEVAFLNANTPKAFVEFWSPQNRARFESLIEARFTETSKRDAVLHAFKKSRHRTFSKLKTVRDRHRRRRVKSYLNTEEQYDYVAQLWRVGRIFPVRGDLTATTTMRQIAERLRQHDRRLGLLYLSNCEQYFAELPPAYRANVIRLPTDERSLILRTRPWLDKLDSSGTDKSMPRTCANCKTRGRLNYTYMYQTFGHFNAWLEHPNTDSVWRMISKRKTRIKKRAYHLKQLPSKR